MTPRHHPLQLPWVRACRTLPHATRTALRDFGQIVRAYVPMFGRGLRFYPTFEEEVEEIRSLDIDVVTAELAVALAPVHGLTDRREFRRTVGEQRFLEAAPGDSPGHGRIRELFDDPDDFRDRILEILTDYWPQAFSKEWARLEESILDRVESAGSQLATEGLESLLVSLIPEVRVEDAGRTVRFERPHRPRCRRGGPGRRHSVPELLYLAPRARRMRPAMAADPHLSHPVAEGEKETGRGPRQGAVNA